MEENKNLAIYNQYRKPPAEALTPITGGRMKGMTDINPMWRIKALTELFGPCGTGWSYSIKDRWTEKCGEEIACFVTIELLYNQESTLCGPVIGTGGSMLYVKEKNGLRLNDEAFKMATTDAIGVCCKQLGIAADVYWGEGTKYTAADEPRGIEQAWTPTRMEMLAVMNWYLSHQSLAKIREAWMTKVREEHPDAEGFDALNDAELSALYNKVHESIKLREEKARKK